jgi:hypothetical protein
MRGAAWGVQMRKVVLSVRVEGGEIYLFEGKELHRVALFLNDYVRNPVP